MFGLRKRGLPSAAEALPGRPERMPVPETHFVTGARLEPPFPAGIEQAVFGMGCFWGAERKFWQTAGRVLDRRRLRGRLHAEPDLRGGLLAARPATPRSCWSSSTRQGRPYDDAAARVLGGPRSDAGHAAGQRRRARSTARRSTRYGDAQQRGGRGVARRVPGACSTDGGLRRDHDRDPPGAGVLLRRGLSPAVPRQEPRRLLRHRRHRRRLPDGPGASPDCPTTPCPSHGLLVLDLTRVLAGPYCTRLLADLGARVIKIERPVEGDEMRRNPHQIEAGRDDQSTYFARVNAGKESVAVDLCRPEGRDVVLGLARHADVFIENFAPGVAGGSAWPTPRSPRSSPTSSTARSPASARPGPGGSARPSPTSSTRPPA